jgi:type IV pilus assembly protein PilF
VNDRAVGITGRRQPLLLLCAVGVVLAGCAAMPDGNAPRELPTASDQSEAERRARVRLELAAAYFANGKVETALDELKLALQVYPALAEAYSLRGLAYAAIGEDALAQENFRRALQLNPRDGGTWHNQGWFQCQRGQQALAQQSFDAALALPQYRDRTRTLLARGVCYARNNQWPEAEAALMRSYELDPSNPGTGFSLAEVLYRRRDLDRARFYINRVNDTPGATNAQTLWLAARIERQLGRESMVRVLGEQLRTRFPQSPEATQFDRGQFDD